MAAGLFIGGGGGGQTPYVCSPGNSGITFQGWYLGQSVLKLGSKSISRLCLPGMRMSLAEPIGSCVPPPAPTRTGTFCFHHGVLRRTRGWILGKKNFLYWPLVWMDVKMNSFAGSVLSVWDSSATRNPLQDICVGVARELSSLPDRLLVLDGLALSLTSLLFSPALQKECRRRSALTV